MEAAYYTLDEASRLTGISPEALRKRWNRGKLRGQKSKQDGKVRVWLDDEAVEAIREAGRPGGQEDGQESEEAIAVNALARVVETLEQQLARTHELLERQSASHEEAIRRERDRVDELRTTLDEVREEKERQRRSAGAQIRRLREELAEAQVALKAGEQPPAAPGPAPDRRPGLLARLLRRRGG